MLRILWTAGVDQEEAVETVMRRLEAIPDKSFSAALAAGDYGQIEKKLHTHARHIWNGNGGQKDPGKSTASLRRAVAKWKEAGIDVINLTGFKTREEYSAPLYMSPVACAGLFAWEPDELGELAALADILVCDCQTAGNVLLTLVKYVESGPKAIAPAFLKDLLRALPVKIGKRSKQCALLRFMRDHGYYYEFMAPSQTAKRSTTYANGFPGRELCKRLCS
jgi:hypothetical protein